MINEEVKKELQQLKSELSSLKIREKDRGLRLKKFLKYSLALSLCTFSLYGIAVIAQLHIFSAGETISAQKINENFEYLENLISGGGSGGISVYQVSTAQTFTLDSTYNNSFIVVSAPVSIELPDISTVSAGFLLRIKQVDYGQFIIKPFSTDLIDGSNDFMYIQNSVTSLQGKGNATVSLISDGTHWNTLLTLGSVNRIDSASIANSCSSGEGTGGTNCYDDSTAKAAGYDYVDGYLMKWATPYWNKVHNGDYLVNDQNSDINSVFTTSYFLANSQPSISGQAGNGLYYIHYSSTVNDLDMNLANYQGTHYNSNDTDLLNTIYNNSSTSMGIYKNCGYLYGPSWRHPTFAETDAVDNSNGIPPHPSGNTWTATPDSGTTNQWKYWGTGYSSGSQTASSGPSYVTCVSTGNTL